MILNLIKWIFFSLEKSLLAMASGFHKMQVLKYVFDHGPQKKLISGLEIQLKLRKRILSNNYIFAKKITRHSCQEHIAKYIFVNILADMYIQHLEFCRLENNSLCLVCWRISGRSGKDDLRIMRGNHSRILRFRILFSRFSVKGQRKKQMQINQNQNKIAHFSHCSLT